MNGKIVSKENIAQTPPQWQHPVLPGNFVQGSLLLTVNEGIEPPQDMSNFRWLPMERIIGTADVKLEYNETTNLYTIFKAKGHLKNDDEWTYEYTPVGSFAGISEEVQEALKDLVYVKYDFDTTEANTLKVYGVQKDGQSILLTYISFVSLAEFNQAVANLTQSINNETTRATMRENEIDLALTNEITRAIARENEIAADVEAEENRATAREEEIKPTSGIATSIRQRENGRDVNVLIDDDTIKIDNNNQLKANVIDDTNVSNDKTYSSSKIHSLITGMGQYRGKVQTMQDLQAIQNPKVGDIYKVIETGNYYIWTGTIWDDLESDYIAGSGIDITDRVISATGVAFGTGNGLQVQGSGAEAVMSVKAGDGFDFASDKTMNLNVGNGLNVDTNDHKLKAKVQNSRGMELNVNGIGIKIDTNGLGFDANGLLKIKIDGTTIYIDENGNLCSAAALNQGNGIEIINEAINVKPKANAGITVSADGVAIDGTIEEWIFTLADASTITKKIMIMN